MNKLIILIAIISIITSCDLTTNKSKNMETTEKQTKSPSPQDTTPKVTGIGGIFFFSENPEKIKDGMQKIWDLK